jgi:hypothetical protein
LDAEGEIRKKAGLDAVLWVAWIRAEADKVLIADRFAAVGGEWVESNIEIDSSARILRIFLRNSLG